MVASLLKMAGLEDWPVPHCAILCRRQRTVGIQIPFRRSSGNLNLLIDIEPVSATGSSEPARGCEGARGRQVAGAAAMARAAGGNGAMSIWRWTWRPEISGRWSSPLARQATVQSCRTCLRRSPPSSLSAPSRLTAPTTHASATRSSPTGAAHPSSPSVATVVPGKKDCPAASARNKTLRATQRFGRALWKRLTG